MSRKLKVNRGYLEMFIYLYRGDEMRLVVTSELRCKELKLDRSQILVAVEEVIIFNSLYFDFVFRLLLLSSGEVSI